MKKYWLSIIIFLILEIPLIFMLLVGILAFINGRQYAKRYYLSIDQLVNAIFRGDEDETISSRIGKTYSTWTVDRKWTVISILNKVLNKIQKNHCIRAIEKDEGKNSTL